MARPEEGDNPIWELFHENSKTSRFANFPSSEVIRARMLDLLESLPYDQYPAIALPEERSPMLLSLDEAMTGSACTARSIRPRSLSLQEVATLLFYAYGQNRDLTDCGYSRGPSALRSALGGHFIR